MFRTNREISGWKSQGEMCHQILSLFNGKKERCIEKIAIVTDSNSGITQAQAKRLGIEVIPMPFFIDGKLYLEDITLTQEEFYQHLTQDSDISTSQPAPGEIMELWDRLLEEYEEIVHIPMSSGLSSSCETAMALAADYDGRVRVVNNQRISVTQRQSVLDAMELAAEGKSAVESRSVWRKKTGCEYLHYRRYLEILEKGRADHCGGSGNRNGAEFKTRSPDSRRETRCVCKSAWMEAGKKSDVRCAGERH